MAERAYKRVTAKGFSIYAWSRLLEIYSSANNIRATFACLVDILDYFIDTMGISNFASLPCWIEEPFFRLVTKNGLKEVERLIKEEKMDRFKPINDLIIKIKTWKIYGHNL